ncbi:MAG: DUF418 domain-containing protein [Phycisphaeraceae bacterium]
MRGQHDTPEAMADAADDFAAPPIDPTPELNRKQPARRMAGLDAARAMAIIGMVMVHFGPSSPPADSWLNWAYGLPHGRASLLFVLLAGIGLTLLAGDGRRERWRLRLTSRVLILLPLGLWLQLMDAGPLVILHYYAMFFVLAVPFLFLRDRFLLVAAAVLAVAGPVTYLLIGRIEPTWLLRFDPVSLGDPPALIARELLATGSYPAMVWMVPFLFGMWLGRRRLRATSTRITLLIGGAAGVAVTVIGERYLPGSRGWWQLASTEPHSQMVLWLLGGTASATAMVGLFLLMSDLLGRVMWPLVAMGQLALTLYVGHLLLLAASPSTFKTHQAGEALVIVAGFALSAAAFATLWRAWFSRGPLEWLLYVAGGGSWRGVSGGACWDRSHQR